MSTHAAIPAAYAAPRPVKGEHEITLYPEWSDDEPVVCHFEHIPGEEQTRDYPGCPEEINLTCAYVRGWDCYRLLDDKQIADLEQRIAEEPREPEFDDIDRPELEYLP
ncbi:hypothetical protein LJR066_002802 [Acidovorax sp. LjRoot66]|uniref:hypothetical protein n=1 Tax=Acidovorax sp. LjRoot66 TaxID=3342334 RepID=UPI003ED0285B